MRTGWWAVVVLVVWVVVMAAVALVAAHTLLQGAAVRPWRLPAALAEMSGG